MNAMKTILIASKWDRYFTLKKAVQSLSNQLDVRDEIILCLNDYKDIPQWTEAYSNIKSYLFKDEKAGNIVWEVLPSDGYVFVCDDDILYPSNYIQRMIQAIEKYKRKVAMVVHGLTLKPTKMYHFKHQARAQQVDVAGVGTLAFHRTVMQISPSNFDYKYLRDLQFSILALQQNVNIYTIDRDLNWLKPLPTSDETIHDIVMNEAYWKEIKDQLITKLLNLRER